MLRRSPQAPEARGAGEATGGGFGAAQAPGSPPASGEMAAVETVASGPQKRAVVMQEMPVRSSSMTNEAS